MIKVETITQVTEAVALAKAEAVAFCTNFFPLQKKLQGWIDHAELFAEFRDRAAFFLRKDRDFWHFYFCARSVEVLRQELEASAGLSQQPVVTDIVGTEEAIGDVLRVLEGAGFRRYSHLQRMARGNQVHLFQQSENTAKVDYADKTDVADILALLDSSFDRFADQLPVAHEIEDAAENRQILAVRVDGKVGAILFFETQGFTSTIRYWAVAEAFRSRQFGSALMKHYFESHPAVRRFILWVVAGNTNAVTKYEHYGYRADGLADHVLANELIVR